MSSESTNSRTDCGFGGVPDPVSKERVRGIRVFDIADIKHPKLVTTVQTCRGSHTHTVVTQPGDNDNVYIYVSGTAGVRSADELPGCADGGIDDPNTRALPARSDQGAARGRRRQAAIVSSPRIFNDLPVPPQQRRARRVRRARSRGRPRRARAAARRRPGRGGAAAGAAAPGGGRGRGRRRPPTGPNQCHDITVYPEIGLAGGACAGLGLLLDIHDAGASGAPRRGGRRQHVVLALGDVQQRRQEDPLHRRVGRRSASRAAAPPTRWSGAPTRSSPSRTTS